MYYIIFIIIFIIISIILFIFFSIKLFNNILKKVLDNILTKSEENFENKNKDIDNIVNPLDKCRIIDNITNNNLNFQTATNIPLSPYKYKNYIGNIYIDDNLDNNKDENKNKIGNDILNNNRELKKYELLYDGIWDDKIKDDLTDNKYVLKKNKLLYDGIWDNKIKNNNGYLKESWKLTNGKLIDGYYFSDKLIEINKPFPDNIIDVSSTPPVLDGNYYTYYNDKEYDVDDNEIACFGTIHNKYPNISF